MQILVVHSSPTNRRIFRNVLRKCGFVDPFLAADLEEVIDRLSSEEVDLLIGEKAVVAGKSGRLRDRLRPHVDEGLAVIFTAYQFSRNDALEAIHSGVDSLLVMPFAPEDLAAKITRVTDHAVDVDR